VPDSIAPAEPSSLAVLGIDADHERAYRTVLRQPALSVSALAEHLGEAESEVERLLGGLVAAGLVSVRDRTALAQPPEEAVGRLITEESRRIQQRRDRLASARQQVLPALTAEHLRAALPGGVPVGVERVAADDSGPLVRCLVAETPGDLLWLRPDGWTAPGAREIDEWLPEVIRSGRRSRALYPARILESAPQVLWERAEAGENVRILAELPCRLAVVGSSVAMLADRHDVRADEGGHLVVRQPSIVNALGAMFETLWEKGMAVPGLGGRASQRDSLAQGLLLDLLSAGAKDEQISRELGISLRTVRRRVSELLDDLGAESRFQAGVEAVRRGWV
jgi:DNA-binding CsgD family transcriptional regulator/DNA-binding transcriptional ArsR family regulator